MNVSRLVCVFYVCVIFGLLVKVIVKFIDGFRRVHRLGKNKDGACEPYNYTP